MASVVAPSGASSLTRTLTPGWTIPVITAVNTVHRLWRWYRIGQAYKMDPSGIAAGFGLDAILSGDSRGEKLFRIAATCICIATRVLECIEHKNAIQKRWNELTKYPKPVIISWKVSSDGAVLSASAVYWLEYNAKCLIIKIQLVFLCIFQTIQHFFHIVMCLLDIVNFSKFSEQSQSMAVKLFFVDIKTTRFLIKKNGKQLLQKIEEITKTSPSSSKAIMVASIKILAFFDQNKTMSPEIAKNFMSEFKSYGTNWGSKMIHEVLTEVGLDFMMPEGGIPDPNPSSSQAYDYTEIAKKFPEKDDLQQGDNIATRV